MRAFTIDPRSKVAFLRETGTLNPRPETVRDPKFRDGEFYDPRDAVQVKYELLRRVAVDGTSVTDACAEYGVSRPTYYQAKAHFEAAGLAGLMPKKRGPRGPHKLRGEALACTQARPGARAPIRARALARSVARTFDLQVHPRTIERAVRGKKTPR